MSLVDLFVTGVLSLRVHQRKDPAADLLLVFPEILSLTYGFLMISRKIEVN